MPKALRQARASGGAGSGSTSAYDVGPAQVIQAVAEAIGRRRDPNVAREPAPSCVAMDFEAGSVRYALRYWLIDPRDDDPTDSAVRSHLLATLQRNGWRIALPDQSVHLVQEDEAHRRPPAA
jgi:small-conductance mechanosensitive channel